MVSKNEIATENEVKAPDRLDSVCARRWRHEIQAVRAIHLLTVCHLEWLWLKQPVAHNRLQKTEFDAEFQ